MSRTRRREVIPVAVVCVLLLITVAIYLQLARPFRRFGILKSSSEVLLEDRVGVKTTIAIVERADSIATLADLPLLADAAIFVSREDPALRAWQNYAAAADSDARPTVDAVAAVLREPISDVAATAQAAITLSSAEVFRAAGVACDGTKTSISFAPFFLGIVTPATVRFFREHELAHVRLRHVDCARGTDVTPTYSETKADSAAIASIRRRLDGCAVLNAAAQFLASHPHPKDAFYPTSSSRVVTLLKPCPTDIAFFDQRPLAPSPLPLNDLHIEHK